ncbi:MAG: SDR family oxidoreductase [Cytophagales bacterium]|nr:SDR family oxidoreductase [Cytophagales bacterium]
MKILITGGAGYIGGELTYQLANHDDVEEVVVYDNLNRGNYNLFISNRNRITNDKVRFVYGDLLDSRTLKSAIKGIDVVYHLAAKVTNPFETVDTNVFEQVNHWGTAEVVALVEETETVKKFYYLSSTAVYGFSAKGEFLTEDSRLNPRSFYGISKMRGEEQVARLLEKIDGAIIRCGNVYGYTPSIRFDSVINRFAFDSNFNNRISIHGNGKQSRSFIHVSKLMTLLEDLRNDKVPNGIYNFADKNLQILDLVDVFKEVYPELEFIFINQHLDLRDLTIDLDLKLKEYISVSDSDFKEEILAMKNESFSF